MSKFTDVLDRYYFAFIDQQRDWDFFLGLADYVRFVYERPESKERIDESYADADKLIDAINEQEIKAVKEMRSAKDELLLRTQEEKLKFEYWIELSVNWEFLKARRRNGAIVCRRALRKGIAVSSRSSSKIITYHL